MSRQSREDRDGGVILQEREQRRVKRPRMYRVLLHNDDYTPMDFVVHLLREVFRRGDADATEIMYHVHNNGVGVAGVFTYEVAETKVAQVHLLARKSEHPLMASMEPEDEEEDDNAEQ